MRAWQEAKNRRELGAKPAHSNQPPSHLIELKRFRFSNDKVPLIFRAEADAAGYAAELETELICRNLCPRRPQWAPVWIAGQPVAPLADPEWEFRHFSLLVE